MESIDIRLGPGNFGRIARRTGITKNHVSRVLRGLRRPTFDYAYLIAREGGVTMEQLYDHIVKFRPARDPLKNRGDDN